MKTVSVDLNAEQIQLLCEALFLKHDESSGDKTTSDRCDQLHDQLRSAARTLDSDATMCS